MGLLAPHGSEDDGYSAELEALRHAARSGPRPASGSDVDAAISEALKGPFLLRIHDRRRAQDRTIERLIARHGLLLGLRHYIVTRDTGKDVLDRKLQFNAMVGLDLNRRVERTFVASA